MNLAYYGQRTPSSADQAMEWLGHPSIVAVDSESISKSDSTVIGFSVATSPVESFFFPLWPAPNRYSLYALEYIIANPNVTKVYQNSLHDLHVLREWNPDSTNIEDTLVMARLQGFEFADLESLAFTLLGINLITHVALMEKYNTKKMTAVPIEETAEMCAKHAEATLAIFEKLKPKSDYSYYKTEISLIPLLRRMSVRGILLDQKVRAELEQELEIEISNMQAMCEPYGMNPASPAQVGYVLAKRYNFLPLTRSKRQYRTDEDVLKKCDDPLAAVVLRFREKSKLQSTYVKPWAMSHRAYTRFHLEAATARISSTDRNMQNIPKGKPRNMFLPDSGVFTDADYEQIELRILAHMSQDAAMLAAFANGLDIHQHTADFLNITRHFGKITNFAMVYGATEETIAEQANVSIYAAGDIKRMWFQTYSGAAAFITEQQSKALNTGRVESLYGRTFHLPSNENPDRIMRKGINYPIQGSAAEILKRAMLKCQHLPMVLTVHDELLFDGAVMLPEDMDTFSPLYTPYTMKLLERWE